MLPCLKREKAKLSSMTGYRDSLPSGASLGHPLIKLISLSFSPALLFCLHLVSDMLVKPNVAISS